MVRKMPEEQVNQSFGAPFNKVCQAAKNFWRTNTPAGAGGPIIYVDLLAQDIRVAIRVLTLAASMRRHMNGRIVALVGPDPHWADMIWSYYSAEHMRQIAHAYGASEVIDLHQMVIDVLDGQTRFTVLGETVEVPDQHSSQRYDEIAEATHLRALRIPVVTDEIRDSDEYRRLERRNDAYARIHDALMRLDVAGVVLSHIDYHQWGFAVDSAMREQVPVFHIQSTGSFKAYALFPETTDRTITARMNWTLQIADFFEQHIWPARDFLHRAAETVAHRARSNHGRPSWWRGGGSISEIGFRSEAQRGSMRARAMSTVGFDPEKPVVAVFNHAISDAVHSNHEIFDDLAQWFTETVAFAARHPEANWLLLDHPAQSFYDGTMMFEGLAEQYADVPHLVFRQSMELTKNELWSLVDLAVTVRGSVSNEYPAYGVPAIQAGWSEWSHLGFSMRADSREQYWDLVTDSIERLRAGERLVSDEEIERARLWLWFYRSGTDVPSGIVPHWEFLQSEALYQALGLGLTQVESDGDPALVAVRRLLQRRDPFLTRVDLHAPQDTLADTLAMPGPVDDGLPDSGPTARHGSDFGLLTIFDEVPQPHPIPLEIISGDHEALVVHDGVIRGISVMARCSWHRATLGFNIEPPSGDVAITLSFTLDAGTHRWWARKFKDLDEGESRRVRHVVVSAGDDIVGGVTIGGEEGHVEHTVVVPRDLVAPGGLLVIQLEGHGSDRFEAPGNIESLQGLQLDSVSIRPAAEEPGTQLYVHGDRVDAASTTQGCVVTGTEPATLRFRVLEQPLLSEPLRGSTLLEPVGRGLRKLGVLRRQRQRRARRADATAVQRAFPVVAERADGESVEVRVELSGTDVLELTFDPAEGRQVVFFELAMRPEQLGGVGFKDRVVFERLP